MPQLETWRPQVRTEHDRTPPHHAIPMLTEIVKLCHERGVIFNFRVLIDGVGQVHNDVRQVPPGFDKANETVQAMQALQQKYRFNFGISSRIFPRTSTTLKTF
ncbi:MAG: hypothetical protein VX453_06900 [Acidobacteriota bacterium]|nr:hypothetical protein [Acidobacteriota bacterium]